MAYKRRLHEQMTSPFSKHPSVALQPSKRNYWALYAMVGRLFEPYASAPAGFQQLSY